jgi:hypothetical protein
VRAYPGPQHFAGDTLTFEILLDDFAEDGAAAVSLSLDGAAPVEVTGRWQANLLIVPQALDTSDLDGPHSLSLSARGDNVSVDETYAFEVLPAAERPAREAQAAWLTRDLPCCRVHYIAGSAA